MKKLTVFLSALVLLLVLASCTVQLPPRTIPSPGTTAAPTEAGCSHTYAAATCTAPKTCTSCGATEGEAKGHTPVTDPAVAASCIATGKTEGSHCSTCSEVITEQTLLPATGHTFSDGKCSICSSLEPSEGLVLTLHESGEYYIVTGLSGCDDTDIIIPNFYEGLPVKEIGEGCFAGRAWFNSVVIQEGVTKIGESAFSGCYGMTSVTIPDSVTSIGKKAFFECMDLKAVKIPEGVAIIRESTFECCYDLSSVDLPIRVSLIGKSAFAYCHKLTSLKFDGIRIVEERAFSACGFPSLELPDCLSVIGPEAFSACHNLTTLVVPANISSFGSSAFSRCYELTDVVISDGATSIGPHAFQWCSKLTSVAIPDSVTDIGQYAFAYCDNLASLTIPDSVTNIGEYAFSGCDNLTSLTIPDSVTGLGERVFSYSTSLSCINYAGTVAQWKETEIRNRKWKIDAFVTEVICTDGTVTY